MRKMKRKNGYSIFIILILISIFVFIFGLFVISRSFSIFREDDDKLKIDKALKYDIEIKDDNKYYDKKTIGEGEDVIASAISKVNLHFSLKFSQEDIDNIYVDDKINAVLTMMGDGKVVKTKKYKLITPEKLTLEEVRHDKIEKDLTIEYGEYLREIDDAVKETGKVINSILNIEMDVVAKNKKDKLKEVMKLEIPITKQNKKIKIKKDLSSNKSIVSNIDIRLVDNKYLVGGLLIILGSIVLL